MTFLPVISSRSSVKYTLVLDTPSAQDPSSARPGWESRQEDLRTLFPIPQFNLQSKLILPQAHCLGQRPTHVISCLSRQTLTSSGLTVTTANQAPTQRMASA